jgi:microsomal dipeptidase-like Zn-dependent dipeptidase
MDTVQTIGVAHVGIGTDLFGLGGSTVIAGYEQFAQLEALLAKRSVSGEDIREILDGNYLRVLREALTV